MTRFVFLALIFVAVLTTFVLTACQQRPVRPYTSQELQDLATEYCGRKPYAFDFEGVTCFLPGELRSNHP
jgi:hypothetical protein